MATLNVRLDDKLKNEAYAVLEKLNITPTEAITVSVRRGNGAHASENRHR